MAEDLLPSVQIVDGSGCFNGSALAQFVGATKLDNYGLNYIIVGVIGPQSSGKSTLMNHLFGTKFKEMDASEGRSKTTQGIWIEKCAGIVPFTIAGIVPFTIAMDIEGTDGSERGEDDTAFEKQSALFALATANILLINIWCHDIGRENAANKPLLKIVFQAMMQLFSPRKTTLLFVIRDQTKTPLEILRNILRQDIQKIWDAVPKPEARKNTPLIEVFDVEVTALSSYEQKEEQFKEQVVGLRELIFNLVSLGGPARDGLGVVPATGFSCSLQQIWNLIKENKDLDLPAHKVMVATVRCEEIANEKLHRLFAHENWLALERMQRGPVPGFENRFNAILNTYLFQYDRETIYFDEDVRIAKREYLQSKAWDEACKRVPNWSATAPASTLATVLSVAPGAISAAVQVAGIVSNFVS